MSPINRKTTQKKMMSPSSAKTSTRPDRLSGDKIC